MERHADAQLGTRTALSDLDDVAGRPVIDRDMVFAISHSGTMVAINLDSGQRVWSRDIGGIQTPWVAGDFLYVLTTENMILCLQRKDGRVKWVHQLPRWEDPDDKDEPIVWSGPVLVSDRLVVDVVQTGSRKRSRRITATCSHARRFRMEPISRRSWQTERSISIPIARS